MNSFCSESSFMVSSPGSGWVLAGGTAGRRFANRIPPARSPPGRGETGWRAGRRSGLRLRGTLRGRDGPARAGGPRLLRRGDLGRLAPMLQVVRDLHRGDGAGGDVLV